MTDSKQKKDAASHEDGEWLQVESLDLDAQGVARKPDGKVVFIEGALPFEEVQFKLLRTKNNWEQGVLTAMRRESSQRVRPGWRRSTRCAASDPAVPASQDQRRNEHEATPPDDRHRRRGHCRAVRARRLQLVRGRIARRWYGGPERNAAAGLRRWCGTWLRGRCLR